MQLYCSSFQTMPDTAMLFEVPNNLGVQYNDQTDGLWALYRAAWTETTLVDLKELLLRAERLLARTPDDASLHMLVSSIRRDIA